MSVPSSFRLALVWLAIGLGSACGGDEACATTDPTCGGSPLLVTSVEPADGALHVDATTPVVLTFSREVDPASVTSTSVTVGPATGTLAVSGAKVTFTPSSPLSDGADYQVRAQGVRAADGGSLASAFTSSFTTRVDPLCETCPATSFSRADVLADGLVVETAHGFIVDGTVSLKTDAQRTVTFREASVDVRFDANGKLQSFSGRVEIPSPHERVAIDDPVHADVGLFRGSFLNQERNLGILLEDDTDYFVFDFGVTLRMSIATGETGEGATKPLVVRAPLGGRVLYIMDARDPMFYVYGAQDLLGAAGTGFSANGRIPFVPRRPVDGLGAFDGSATLVGRFSVLNLVIIEGQIVDNAPGVEHLIEGTLPAHVMREGYGAGFNGNLSLGVPLFPAVTFSIPIADASGGIRAVAGAGGTGVDSHVYAKGVTPDDDSWWPAFIPTRPLLQLDAQMRVNSDETYQVLLAGEFGFDFPQERESLAGSFEVTHEAMTFTGTFRDGDIVIPATGVVTQESTTAYLQPPPELLSLIHDQVNEDVMGRIDEAQAAWENLREATENYEFELSLRGLRSSIPTMVDAAKKALSDAIASQLAPHQGEIYYSSLAAQVNQAAAPYYTRLDRLKTAALAIQDNAATRAAIESALREAANSHTFTTSYTYYILGVPVKTVTITRRVLTTSQVATLLTAADNVKYIAETSDIMISMKQIYDTVPERELWESVRDDIQNGLLVMEDIDQMGFVVPHGETPTFNFFAVIGGQRKELGTIGAMTIAELARGLPAAMIEVLKGN